MFITNSPFSLPFHSFLPLSLSLFSLFFLPTVAPRVSPITPLHYSVPVGDPLQLLVEYTGGYPDPSVTWYQLIGSDRELLTDIRATQSGLHNINVTISNSTVEDNKVFFLRLNNSVGSQELIFNVTILGKR